MLAGVSVGVGVSLGVTGVLIGVPVGAGVSLEVTGVLIGVLVGGGGVLVGTGVTVGAFRSRVNSYSLPSFSFGSKLLSTPRSTT